MNVELNRQIRRGIAYCKVLLANGDNRRKLQLKISNQDYPEKRDYASDWIIRQVISAQVAKQLMTSGRLYLEGMDAEHDKKCQEAMEELLEKMNSGTVDVEEEKEAS